MSMIAMASRGVLAVCLVLGLSATVVAQAPPPSGMPIASHVARLLPIIAPHAAVTTQEYRATRVGLDILQRGGNAVDAAVAVGFALAVTLPAAGNLGGGGFMLVHLSKTNENIAIDYRETAPKAATPDMFLDAAGKPDAAKSTASGLGIGIPGSVAGLAEAEARYGSGKFTLAQLIEPAISLARYGIEVDAGLIDTFAEESRLGHFPSSRAIFYRNDRPLGRGDQLIQTDLATTLSAIAIGGPDAFYHGPIAEKIVGSVKAFGGVMTTEDLDSYRAIIRKPVTGNYRGIDVVSMPPPSSGGVHIIEILNLLEGFDLSKLGAQSAAQIHLLAEAEKLAYADRAAYLGDPDRAKLAISGLISKDYAAQLRLKIDPDRARSASQIAAGTPQPYESDQTTHFSIVDSDGNAVANTYSLNYFFGVGLVADGTGVLLNNTLDDFAAKSGAQNSFGLIGGTLNGVAPGARPLSSMSPTMLFKNGKLFMVTGSIGGSRIITHVIDAIINVIDNGMNIAEAIAAPHIHDQWQPDLLFLEAGISPDTIGLLQAMGHKVVTSNASGGTNSIVASPQGYEAASEPRYRGTLAAGY